VRWMERRAPFSRLLKNSFFSNLRCGTWRCRRFSNTPVFEKRSKVKITLFALRAEKVQDGLFQQPVSGSLKKRTAVRHRDVPYRTSNMQLSGFRSEARTGRKPCRVRPASPDAPVRKSAGHRPGTRSRLVPLGETDDRNAARSAVHALSPRSSRNRSARASSTPLTRFLYSSRMPCTKMETEMPMPGTPSAHRNPFTGASVRKPA